MITLFIAYAGIKVGVRDIGNVDIQTDKEPKTISAIRDMEKAIAEGYGYDKVAILNIQKLNEKSN